MPHYAFDGEVTLYVAHPWVSFGDGAESIRLIPNGPGVRPTTDGGERNDWDRLVLIADPMRAAKDVRQARVQPTPRRWQRASGPTPAS